MSGPLEPVKGRLYISVFNPIQLTPTAGPLGKKEIDVNKYNKFTGWIMTLFGKAMKLEVIKEKGASEFFYVNKRSLAKKLFGLEGMESLKTFESSDTARDIAIAHLFPQGKPKSTETLVTQLPTLASKIRSEMTKLEKPVMAKETPPISTALQQWIEEKRKIEGSLSVKVDELPKYVAPKDKYSPLRSIVPGCTVTEEVYADFYREYPAINIFNSESSKVHWISDEQFYSGDGSTKARDLTADIAENIPENFHKQLPGILEACSTKINGAYLKILEDNFKSQGYELIRKRDYSDLNRSSTSQIVISYDNRLQTISATRHEVYQLMRYGNPTGLYTGFSHTTALSTYDSSAKTESITWGASPEFLEQIKKSESEAV